MSANEQANVKVTLNGEEAQRELDQLNERIKKLIELKKKAEAEGDVKGWKKINTELSKAEREAKKLEKQFYDVEKVLKNMNGASLKELREAQRSLTSQTEKLNRETKEFVEKSKQLKLINAEISKINGQYRAQTGFISRASDGFNKYFGMATAAIASLTGIAFGFKKASQASNDFEERVDNLSSLTGLAGEELQWLEQRSKELSTSVLADGVKVKQGAQEIIDAFTKTGSARPELLKNKEALSEVTEEAIILSNASKDELQPSIEALTMVLNQYNEKASESRRIINALAAGSKEGAGEIPYLTTGFEKAGTVAADADISIETLVATLETLAPRITQAEIAGRSLKGVILDMQTSTDDINPSIVGWTTALENLNKKHLTTTQLTKMFGTENITTAKILLNNIGELKKYETAVTGTNVAIEQATINTGNNNAKLAQARNHLQNVTIELGKKLSPAMLVSTNGFVYFVKAATAGLDILSKYGRTIITSSAAVVGYTLAMKYANAETMLQIATSKAGLAIEKGYIAVKQLLTGQITLATFAQRGWNAAMKANPIGLIIGIIAGGIAWLISWNRETGKVTEAFKKLGPVFQEIKQWFVDLYNESFLVRAGFHYFFSMLQTGFTAVKIVLQSVWEQLKLGVKLLAAVLTLDFKGFKQAFVDYGNNMKSVVIDSAKNLGETWATGFNAAVKGKIKPVDVKVNGPLLSKQNTGVTFSGIGDLVTAQNPYVRPGKPSPNIPDSPTADTSETDAEIKARDDAYKKAQEAFDNAATVEMNNLKQQLLDKKLTQEQFNLEMFSIELAHLMAMKELRAKFGQETASTDAQILNKKIEGQAVVNKQIEAAEKLSNSVKADSAKDWEAEQKDILKSMDDDSKKYAESREKDTEAQIAKEFEISDARKQLQVEYIDAIGQVAGALASMFKEGSAAQIAALAVEKSAAIAQIIFQTAIANAKAVAISPLTAGQPWVSINTVSAAASIAGIVATTISSFKDKKNNDKPGYAEGKYPSLQTGMYGDKPHYALFNEVPGQPEMVVDGLTTRKIMLNYPEIARAIYAIRDGRQPGYAEGKYPSHDLDASKLTQHTGLYVGGINDKAQNEIIKQLVEAVNELKNLKVYASIEDIRKADKNYTEIQNTRGL